MTRNNKRYILSVIQYKNTKRGEENDVCIYMHIRNINKKILITKKSNSQIFFVWNNLFTRWQHRPLLESPCRSERRRFRDDLNLSHIEKKRDREKEREKFIRPHSPGIDFAPTFNPLLLLRLRAPSLFPFVFSSRRIGTRDSLTYSGCSSCIFTYCACCLLLPRNPRYPTSSQKYIKWTFAAGFRWGHLENSIGLPNSSDPLQS